MLAVPLSSPSASSDEKNANPLLTMPRQLVFIVVLLLLMVALVVRANVDALAAGLSSSRTIPLPRKNCIAASKKDPHGLRKAESALTELHQRQ